jgi:hypothetical protein
MRLGMEVALRKGQYKLYMPVFRKITNLRDQVCSTVMGPEGALLGEDIRQLEDNLDQEPGAWHTVDSCAEEDGPWMTPTKPRSPVEP